MCIRHNTQDEEYVFQVLKPSYSIILIEFTYSNQCWAVHVIKVERSFCCHPLASWWCSVCRSSYYSSRLSDESSKLDGGGGPARPDAGTPHQHQPTEPGPARTVLTPMCCVVSQTALAGISVCRQSVTTTFSRSLVIYHPSALHVVLPG